MRNAVHGVPVTQDYSWIISDDGTSATRPCPVSNFVYCTTAFEIQYCNDYNTDQTWIGSGIYVIYSADTAPTYDVTINEAIANGSVTATPNPAKEGDTVTVTVEAETGYAYVVNSLKVTDATGGEVEVDEDTKTFVMPDSSVTVYAEFEKLSTTSADIVWGSMSFTYSDTVDENTGKEAGWSVAAAEEGKQANNTVIVTNNGDTGFTASVAYAANEDYEDLGVTGSFDTDSATLEKDASQTFTLTLSGKPNRALSDAAIGSVTVTISEAAASTN